ncbi:MAG: hypothetical protein HY040_00735 [Planctomycetes bacterium]|nr:hypothetical protein [Planctomycetota bacterium]
MCFFAWWLGLVIVAPSLFSSSKALCESRPVIYVPRIQGESLDFECPYIRIAEWPISSLEVHDLLRLWRLARDAGDLDRAKQLAKLAFEACPGNRWARRVHLGLPPGLSSWNDSPEMWPKSPQEFQCLLEKPPTVRFSLANPMRRLFDYDGPAIFMFDAVLAHEFAFLDELDDIGPHDSMPRTERYMAESSRKLLRAYETLPEEFNPDLSHPKAWWRRQGWIPGLNGGLAVHRHWECEAGELCIGEEKAHAQARVEIARLSDADQHCDCNVCRNDNPNTNASGEALPETRSLFTPGFQSIPTFRWRPRKPPNTACEELYRYRRLVNRMRFE